MVSTHISGISEGDRWENIHFSSKPRHVTPQINRLGTTSLVLMHFNINLWSFSGDRWENIHFSSKPWHVTPQIDHLRKTSPVLMVPTHISGISKEIDGKTFIFSSKPRHVTPQIDHLRKTIPVLRVSTHIYGISQEIDGKTFIFQVNLGMWPLKSIVSEKQALFWCFQHTFMVISKDIRWENIHFSSKPRHVTPQIDRLRKMSPVLRVSTHIYCISQEIDGKTFIFE